MNSETFPVEQQEHEKRWEEYNNRYPAITRDITRFQWGAVQPMRFQFANEGLTHHYPSPTVNPENRHYSLVETAKRNRQQVIEQQTTDRQRRVFSLCGVGCAKKARPWERCGCRQSPQDFLFPFQEFRPNIRNFNKPLNLSLPQRFL
jgi:hypothetical protein